MLRRFLYFILLLLVWGPPQQAHAQENGVDLARFFQSEVGNDNEWHFEHYNRNGLFSFVVDRAVRREQISGQVWTVLRRSVYNLDGQLRTEGEVAGRYYETLGRWITKVIGDVNPGTFCFGIAGYDPADPDVASIEIGGQQYDDVVQSRMRGGGGGGGGSWGFDDHYGLDIGPLECEYSERNPTPVGMSFSLSRYVLVYAEVNGVTYGRAAVASEPDDAPQLSSLMLSVYPTLVTSAAQAQVTSAVPGPIRLEVFDVAGRRVWLQPNATDLGPGHTTRFGEDLRPGSYFVRAIDAEGNVATSRFTKL
ncbi:MAG: T9SS type A sorting domain-containing protein [Bacteroidota bacterium]